MRVQHRCEKEKDTMVCMGLQDESVQVLGGTVMQPKRVQEDMTMNMMHQR